MNSPTEIMPMEAAVARKATLRERFFRICYLTATAVAMVGWLSAFGWVTVTITKWAVGLVQISGELTDL
jgi:hypothetical protein